MLRLARVTAVVLTVVALGAGCAHSQGPVLYPNAKLNRPLTLPSPPQPGERVFVLKELS